MGVAVSVVRDPATDRIMAIVCDGNTAGAPCPVEAPLVTRGAPAAPDGLVGLGWYCKGGKHLCPEHNVEDV